MDVLTPQQRSHCMSRIRGKNTTPERHLRAELWALGFRYRLNYPVFGKPDIVLPGRKVAIFVDGCFWHSCPEHGARPKTNAKFWKQKLKRNADRDLKVNKSLTKEGWTVLRFWEHEVHRDVAGVLKKIERTFGRAKSHGSSEGGRTTKRRSPC